MKAVEIVKGQHLAWRLAIPLTGSCMVLSLSGCLVAGYSSRGGAFVWPGGFGFLILLAILFFFLRGRR
jgi:uncharacterized membrane protein YfcA